MKICSIASQYRNDFTAVMICEHCNHEQRLTSGYDDENYHQRVIPAQRCEACGKDRAGSLASDQREVEHG